MEIRGSDNLQTSAGRDIVQHNGVPEKNCDYYHRLVVQKTNLTNLLLAVFLAVSLILNLVLLSEMHNHAEYSRAGIEHFKANHSSQMILALSAQIEELKDHQDTARVIGLQGLRSFIKDEITRAIAADQEASPQEREAVRQRLEEHHDKIVNDVEKMLARYIIPHSGVGVIR